MNIQDFYYQENEKPLDKLVSDGDFASIFRNIACIGDSLSSGEFEATDENGKTTYHDEYDYSWGQFLARMCGSTCYNLSKGGMTVRGFLNKFGNSVNYLDVCQKCEAITIALCVNDFTCMEKGELEFFYEETMNSEDAFAEGKDDFAGSYAQLMRNIIAVNPFMNFFLVVPPRETERTEIRVAMVEKFRSMAYRLAEFFPRTYVLDLYAYAPIYDKTFRDRFYMGNHLNPAGYALTAKIIASYIDFIVRSHPEKFCQLGFTHTGTKNNLYFK